MIPLPGHVEERHKSSFTIVIDLGRDPVTGKRKRIARNVKVKKKKEAEAIMRHMLAQYELGELSAPANITLAEFLDYWLKNYVELHLAPKSQKRYSGIARNHLKPRLGKLKLDKLRPTHIQALYSWWLIPKDQGGPGLTPATVRKHHIVLHRALGHAVRWQLISRNPVAAVEPPKITRPVIPVLPDATAVNNLLAACKESVLYLPVLLAATAGLRRGEICGLRWEDVDWETGRLRIQHSLQRVKGKLALRPTKTASSVRPVALLPTVLEELKIKKAKQEEYRADLGPLYVGTGEFVCSWPDGRPLDPDYVTKAFAKLVRSLGLKITFHGLRHTHNTLLLRAGVHPRLVADRSGHSQPTVAMDVYSHVLPDMQDQVAAVLESVLFGQRSGNGSPENAPTKH